MLHGNRIKSCSVLVLELYSYTARHATEPSPALYTQSPAYLIYKATADWKSPSNWSINTNITFSRTSIFCRYFLPNPSSPRVWLIFAVLRCKTVVSPPRKRGNLCCCARKAIVRRHESTTNILVLHGDFACQQSWLCQSLGLCPRNWSLMEVIWRNLVHASSVEK